MYLRRQLFVDDSDYRKHDKSGGYEGFSMLADGTIAAFLEKKGGDTTLTVSQPYYSQ